MPMAGRLDMADSWNSPLQTMSNYARIVDWNAGLKLG
jgi:hypothetical protein